jgi:hypothetical protein
LGESVGVASLEWVVDLSIEYEGRPAARLRSGGQHSVLEIANLAAFRSLRGSAGWRTGLGTEWLKHVFSWLPDSLEIELNGVAIGIFKPFEPLNWAAKAAGLPCGNLVTDKLALLRAALKGTP